MGRADFYLTSAVQTLLYEVLATALPDLLIFGRDYSMGEL